MGLGHSRVLHRRPDDGRVKRGHQQAGVHLASSTRISTVVSWLTYPFMLIIKNVSWTGPGATINEQIGCNVVDIVAKAIWAIAAGKSRIEEEGAGSVVLVRKVKEPWHLSLGEFTDVQWSAVYNALPSRIAATGEE